MDKLKKALKDDTIIVFLSGHGAPDPSNPSDFYFVTYDADPEYLGASSVKMSGLEFARHYDAQRVLVIADACHAGGFSFLTQGAHTKSTAPAMEQFLARNRRIIRNRHHTVLQTRGEFMGSGQVQKQRVYALPPGRTERQG